MVSYILLYQYATVTKLSIFYFKREKHLLTKKGYMSDTRISVTCKKMGINMANRSGISDHHHHHLLVLRLYLRLS